MHSVFSKIIDNGKDVNWKKKKDAFILIVLIRIYSCVYICTHVHSYSLCSFLVLMCI